MLTHLTNFAERPCSKPRLLAKDRVLRQSHSPLVLHLLSTAQVIASSSEQLGGQASHLLCCQNVSLRLPGCYGKPSTLPLDANHNTHSHAWTPQPGFRKLHSLARGCPFRHLNSRATCLLQKIVLPSNALPLPSLYTLLQHYSLCLLELTHLRCKVFSYDLSCLFIAGAPLHPLACVHRWFVSLCVFRPYG